jgi:DNA polymerase-3 subunit alpha
MYIVFDTETTGKAKNFSAPITDFNNWPRMVQIAWKVFDANGVEIDSQNLIIKPQGFKIPDEAIAIHRITNEIAKERGIPLRQALDKFTTAVGNNKHLIAHNMSFDENVTGCEFLREGMHNCVPDINHIDTMKLTTDFVAIPNKRGRSGFKFPSQTELHKKLFDKGFDDAHDALADVTALARCFFELQRIGILGFKEEEGAEDLMESLSITAEEKPSDIDADAIRVTPLGLHTFHSILDGAGSIDEYIKLAKNYGHTSMAITDNSTLSGTFEFFNKCKSNGIKPVFGIEIFLNDNIGKFEEKELEGDNYKIKIFIKNEQGYRNLNHLLYLANTEGFFKKEARISTEWLLKYKEGLVVSTSGLDSKLANLVLKGKVIDAENYVNMLRREFADNLIVEFKFSKFTTQKQYNNFLIKMMRKYKLFPVMSNDTYYPRKEDSKLQDVVTSIKQHRMLAYCSLKENRELYYFNSDDYREMNTKYGFGYPEKFLELCMKNTNAIADKCNFEFDTGTEKYPRYEPTEKVINYFKTDKTEDIIVKLSFAKLNGIVEITDEKIDEYVARLNYEISIIKSKKMLDYFMVNWEIINFYRDQGHDIGPARGCFQIGSRVKMADGMYAPIETIKPGDEVIDAFGESQYVVNRFEYDIEEEVIELEFDNGKKIICTLDHEILTKNRRWVAAKDLTEDDDIVEV